MGFQSEPKNNTYSGRYVVRGGSHSVTIPPPLRRKLGLVHGDYIIWFLVGDVLRLRKVTPGMVLKGEFWEAGKEKESEGDRVGTAQDKR